MKTSMKFSNKLTMVAEMTGDSKFQVLEYDDLHGATDIETAFGLKIMKESGVKLKQVRVLLEDSSVKLEAGALSYMRGDIDIKVKTGGVLGIGKKFISSKLTGEEMFKPTYHGTGDIFLEPSFGHFALIALEDEEIIVDDGLFYACEETVEIGTTMQKSISSMVFGNEGLYQVKLSGRGIVVLEIPVPETEIFKCKLFNDTLKVDGNFAILRSEDIDFRVEKSSSAVGSVASGEGLLNVYSGTGEVWLIPTKAIYNEVKARGLSRLSNPGGLRDTEI